MKGFQTNALTLDSTKEEKKTVESRERPLETDLTIHDRVLVSAVNSVQRQFLPNGLPLMDDSLMELPSTEKTTTSWESFGRLLG